MTPDRDGEIAKRAYRIWEGEGRPSGRDLDHWLRAEAEVTAQDGKHTPSQAPATAQHLEVVPATSPAKPQRPAPRRSRRAQ